MIGVIKAEWDIARYLAAASERQEEYILCVNGYSSFVTNERDCAQKMWKYARQPNVGLVGATGSFEDSPLGCPLFPNPHIRSGGFMIRRTLLSFLGFSPPLTKRDCYAFESGSNSLTVRIKELGLDCLVVGSNGIAYEEKDWPISRTFRSGNQENLLIEDNHTEVYQAASSEERQRLSRKAWGVSYA